MKKVISYLIVLIMISCGIDDNSVKSNYQKEYSENGLLIHEGLIHEGSKEGVHKWYYPSGNLSMINSYDKGVENGYRIQFFDDIDNNVQLKSIYKNGRLIDTTYIYNKNGKCVSKEVYYSDTTLYHKIMFDESGRVTQKSEFIKLYGFEEETYYHNTFVYFDTNGNVLSGSSSYVILNSENKFLKDSICHLEVFVLPLYGEDVTVVFGEIEENYDFNNYSDLSKMKVENNRFLLPLETGQIGENTIRFIINDTKIDTTYGKSIRSMYGKFKYSVSKAGSVPNGTFDKK